ncbi:MAG: single-stranded-DNA-specific exonuclease RecJ [Lachnospiraceae bacterium]|nr:single-stranded-DNA-specific exonuclease RecJ [Lachnospiraceae bacterium]
MEEKWLVAAKHADTETMAKKLNMNEILVRVLMNRGLDSEEGIGRFLKGTLADLYDGSLMKDMNKALIVLEDAVRKGEKIRIIGDYDVDGVTAACILLRVLREAGGRADTVIPHRVIDGYGLNDRLIEEAKADGIDLILTCDNGIAASAQIRLAAGYGMKVVVTDHHEVPYNETEDRKTYILPAAEAVVDPKREDCPYPFKGICGAVVAWKLGALLLKRLSAERNIDPDAVMRELLPFAALATVCDVMELRDENRIIVREGLSELRKTRIPGLAALLEVNGLAGKAVTAYHAGFVLGPCLNATGRLDTAQRAVELFETGDPAGALSLAGILKQLNEERKELTERGVEMAIESITSGGFSGDRVLVVYLPGVHESIAGIIAGKVREHFGKPSFVITDSEEGVKGSGRSIEEYDMYAELTKVSDLFTNFGGHKMAAGLSMASSDDVLKLRKRLNGNCTLTGEDLALKIRIDAEVPLSDITLRLLDSLSAFEPYGVGNPKPRFTDRGVSLLSYSILGKNRNAGKFRVKDRRGSIVDIITFGNQDLLSEDLSGLFGEDAPGRLMRGEVSPEEMVIDLVYSPQINEFRGTRNIQIVMEHYRRSETEDAR